MLATSCPWCECHTRASSRRGGGGNMADWFCSRPPAVLSTSGAMLEPRCAARGQISASRFFHLTRLLDEWAAAWTRRVLTCSSQRGGAWSSCRSGSRSQQRSPSGMWVCASVFESLSRGRLPCRPGSESQRRGSCEGDPVWTGADTRPWKCPPLRIHVFFSRRTFFFLPAASWNKRGNISSKVKQTDRRPTSLEEERLAFMKRRRS